MSDQVPGDVFALSIVAGICWSLRLLRRQIWEIIESMGGIERLIVGLFMVVGIDHSGEVLVAVLAFRLLWMALRDDRSFDRLERGVRIGVLAGLAFLLLTPFSSGLFYFVVPQPDSRTVAIVLHVVRNVSVALLIGSSILPRISSGFSSSS
ncbi:hypothetical protein [Halorubrum aethiopicum]|uniref:hypothetical protein n=1 Tax=Halorubrum aethiopicum TaxID=1758255 RepID=UPI00083647F4|nr:hypothetical protein [Halorubrum aethiopicum]